MLGVDYAFYPHPTTAALKTAGAKFVGRYVSPQAANDANGKNLLPAELKTLRAAGMSIILYAEQYAARMKEGKSAGVADAQHFDRVTKALGMTGAVMYCAADWDATVADQTPINAYLDGVASVIGRARTGIYGGYYPVKRALDAGKAKFAVQTIAWSGGQWDARAHVRQGLYIWVGGCQVDRLDSMKDDYGQWPRPASEPKPPAPTGLKVGALTAKLTWAAVSGATKYIVRVWDAGIKVADMSVTATSANLALTPGHSYDVYVRAVSSAGTGAASEPLKITV